MGVVVPHAGSNLHAVIVHIAGIGGQIDVFPTIMGLLGQPYLNNTLGIDLLNEKRPFIYFSDDDKIGVLDQEHLLIRKSNKTTRLHHYSKNKEEYSPNNDTMIAKDMEEYAKVNLQVFQNMLFQNSTFYKPMESEHQE